MVGPSAATPESSADHASQSLTPAQAENEAHDVVAASVDDPAVTTAGGAVPVAVTSIGSDGTPRIEQVMSSDPDTAADEVRAIADATVSDGGQVLTVETDLAVQVDGAPITDDPWRPQQWALSQFDFEAVWPRGNGTGACVAVVDSGVQIDHPDLTGVVVASNDWTGQGVSVAGGHGTHVAGIIAAVPHNAVGTVGAAPGIDMLNAKVLRSDGAGWDSWVAAGVVWAVDQGADVINLSLGSSCLPTPPISCRSTAMEQAMDHARDHDVVVVASAGNDGASGRWSWPAAFEWPIAVASVSQNGAHSDFSTIAPYVDVTAPGAEILSTLAGNGYGYASGTSMSAPYVTALAALSLSAHPSESALQTRNRIQSTATDRGTPGTDPSFGHGVVEPGLATA